jgi:hypothetical protein
LAQDEIDIYQCIFLRINPAMEARGAQELYLRKVYLRKVYLRKVMLIKKATAANRIMVAPEGTSKR